MIARAPRLSVIVPTYQRRDSLRRLLEALRGQSVAPDQFEVIVVIDGSSDGTVQLVADFPAPFPIAAIFQENSGRAAACNEGIRAARGELVVLLDDDMEPSPALLAAHLDEHEGDPRLAVLGAVPIRTDAPVPHVTRFIAAKFAAHLDRLAAGGPIGYRSFYSGNLSIRRDVLLEVGLFDRSYREYGNEDTELALRLIEAGVALRYSAGALAHQHYEKDLDDLARDSLAKGGTAVLTARKHPRASTGLDLESFRSASAKWTDRSGKWKALRSAFIAASRYSALPQRTLIRLVRASERWNPARLEVRYLFVIDCFYWLGVARSFSPRAESHRSVESGAGARRVVGEA